MSRKDYTLIAAALNKAWHAATNVDERYGVIVSVSHLATALATTNEHFNLNTFKDAVYA